MPPWAVQTHQPLSVNRMGPIACPAMNQICTWHWLSLGAHAPVLSGMDEKDIRSAVIGAVFRRPRTSPSRRRSQQNSPGGISSTSVSSLSRSAAGYAPDAGAFDVEMGNGKGSVGDAASSADAASAPAMGPFMPSTSAASTSRALIGILSCAVFCDDAHVSSHRHEAVPAGGAASHLCGSFRCVRFHSHPPAHVAADVVKDGSETTTALTIHPIAPFRRPCS